MRRLSRRELTRLYVNALSQRDEARRERDDSRSLCSAQAAELGKLHDQLTARPPAPARVGDATELARAKATIRRLDEQLRVMEASNLEYSRQAMTRAGTATEAASA
ncbi:hypothetical protein AB0D99_10460 [Streptomyces sp. NPDC047971]|uniref:hypothetical protein n=1 Tax=Streptomyces sp. NPDC047971 TaxID=3154499 RepID=UPI0033E8C064